MKNKKRIYQPSDNSRAEALAGTPLASFIRRAIGYGASTLEFGFGFFQYFIRSDRRTIHDRIAETIVVAEPPKKKKGEGAG